MPDEIALEIKLYVVEKLEKYQKEVTTELKEARNSFRTTIAMISSILGLFVLVGAYGAASLAASNALKTTSVEKLVTNIEKYESDSSESYQKIKDLEKKAQRLGYLIPLKAILPINASLTELKELEKHGWFVCDGNNETPDLRGRFIVAADKNNKIGDIGGKDVNKWQLVEEQSGVDGRHWVCNYYVADGNTPKNFGPKKPEGINVENRPRYYTLAFIMKVK